MGQRDRTGCGAPALAVLATLVATGCASGDVPTLAGGGAWSPEELALTVTDNVVGGQPHGNTCVVAWEGPEPAIGAVRVEGLDEGHPVRFAVEDDVPREGHRLLVPGLVGGARYAITVQGLGDDGAPRYASTAVEYRAPALPYPLDRIRTEVGFEPGAAGVVDPDTHVLVSAFPGLGLYLDGEETALIHNPVLLLFDRAGRVVWHYAPEITEVTATADISVAALDEQPTAIADSGFDNVRATAVLVGGAIPPDSRPRELDWSLQHIVEVGAVQAGFDAEQQHHTFDKRGDRYLALALDGSSIPPSDVVRAFATAAADDDPGLSAPLDSQRMDELPLRFELAPHSPTLFGNTARIDPRGGAYVYSVSGGADLLLWVDEQHPSIVAALGRDDVLLEPDGGATVYTVDDDHGCLDPWFSNPHGLDMFVADDGRLHVVMLDLGLRRADERPFSRYLEYALDEATGSAEIVHAFPANRRPAGDPYDWHNASWGDAQRFDNLAAAGGSALIVTSGLGGGEHRAPADFVAEIALHEGAEHPLWRLDAEIDSGDGPISLGWYAGSVARLPVRYLDDP